MSAGPSVAVIDDDPAIRIALSSLIRSAGFAVALFETGDLFLASLARAVPHCVLTDIQMPGISGLELQDRLLLSHPALPVLVMTAFPEPALRDRALANGARAFLTKPFDADALIAQLRAATGSA